MVKTFKLFEKAINLIQWNFDNPKFFLSSFVYDYVYNIDKEWAEKERQRLITLLAKYPPSRNNKQEGV